MQPARTHVAHGKNHSFRQFALDVQVVLQHVRSGIGIVIPSGSGAWFRDIDSAGSRNIGVASTHKRNRTRKSVDGPGISGPESRRDIGNGDGRVEDAESPANGGLMVGEGIESEPKTRVEVL